MARNLQLQVVLSALDKATAPLRAITKSSSGLGAQLKQTRDQLKGLQSQQSNIQSFKALKAASEQSKQAMSEQQQKVKQLAAGMRQAEVPTKAMTKEFQAATREAHRLKQSHSANSQQLQAMRGKLSEAGISTKNLGEAERALRGRISETNQSLTEQQNRLKSVTEQQKRLSAAKAQYERTTQLASNMTTAGAGAMAAGGGALYGIGRVMQTGVEFDAGMSNVQALTRLDKNSPEMQKLRDQAKILGAETMFTATQAAEGQGFLAMAGFTPEAILDSMPGVLDLAKAGGMELSQTADIVSNVMSAMGMESSEMGRIGDALASTFTSTNTSLGSLGDTMKFAAPVASALGVDIETLLAMTGALGDAGIQGSMAGTGLSTIMVRIAKPTKEVLKGLDKIGISAKDAANQMKTPEKLLEQIYKKTKNMSDSERISVLGAISGQEALKSMVTLVNKAGTQELHESIQARNDALGTSARASKAMSDNLAGDLEGLSSAFDGVKITVFEDQNSALRSLAASATDVMRAINAWALANPELVSTIIKGAAVIAALVAAGGALLVMLGSLLGPLAMVKYAITVLGIKSLSIIPAIKAIGTTVMLLGKAMLASPLGIFMALAAVAAILIIKHWDLVKAFFKGFVQGFMQGFKSMGSALADAFKPLLPALKVVTKAGKAALKWVKDLLAPVTSAQEKLDAAGVAGKSFGEVIGALAALAGVAIVIKTIGSAILFMGKMALANPVVALIVLLAGAAYLIYQNWAPIKEFFINLWGGVSNYLVGIWNQIKAAFSGGIGGIFALLVNWSPLGLFYKAMAGVLGYFGVELPGTFSEFGGGLISSFTEGLSAAWSGITEFFTARFEDVKTAFSGGIGGISALIVNWSPLGLFYQVFAGVMEYFGIDLPGKFSEFGAMIMQGLVSGIKNAAGAVKDAVVGMGDSVGGWFKDKLGIKSPSRVFMQFGDDTAEGLALGIAANKDSPLKQVAGMAKQVAAAGAIALSVGVTPAIADNKGVAQNLMPVAQPDMQDQQQRILQNVQPAVVPAVQDQQQVIRQSLMPITHEQQALPALTQNIQQMIISAKQVLPDLTQRIISVFSGPSGAAPESQKKLFNDQPSINFDTRAPIGSPTAQPRGQGGNITNNYTITVTGGGDPKELADEVMRQIEAYNRQQQVRTRSRFGDLD